MTSNRLRGLIQMHVVATTVLATAFFLIAALGVRYIPFLSLIPEVDLLVYSLPVAIGMLISGRFWVPLRSRFHTITWIEAAGITLRQVLTVALLIFALIVATKDRSISRLFLANFLVGLWVLLLFANRRLPGYLAAVAFQRAHQVPALLVGPMRALAKIDSWIRQKQHLGISVVGLVSDEPAAGTVAPVIPWLGRTADLARIIEERGIGEVILLDMPYDPEETRRYVEVCQAAGCRFLIYQNYWDRLPFPMEPVIEDEHLFLTVHDEPLEDPFNRGIKRLYDIAISLPVVLFVLPPLCLVVALIQAVQAPGPLMFKRSRGGQRGREFGMLKFRSMYAQEADPALEARQASPGDTRIYPFGHFLRRTSLDEFPQFWNVLMGNMSVVGPRPHLPQHDQEFSMLAKTYRTRHLVKPGITGLAQVRGYRGEISDPELLQKRVQFDIVYITTWSIWLDLQITAMTFLQVVRPPATAR